MSTENQKTVEKTGTATTNSATKADSTQTVQAPVVLETPQQREYRECMQKIEHTNLSPAASPDDVQTLCQDAATYGFHSICVHPVYLNTAYKTLKKSENLLKVYIATVAGYPFGETLLKSKVAEIKSLFKAKADIVDVYLNISSIKYLNRKDKAIKRQLKKFSKFTKIVNEKNRDKKKDRIIRIVVDTRYFSMQEIQTICNYCIKFKITYVTLTEGLTSTKLNFAEIQSLVTSFAGQLNVKLNYNVKSVADLKALKYIDLVATKFGPDIGDELQNRLDDVTP